MSEPAGRANDRPTIDGLDLLAATWEQGVPYDQFDRLRREAPVAWHEEDDGPGFDVASATERPGGFGLPSVRERLRLVGGRFEVDSAPRQGTRVTLSVPAGPSASGPPAPVRP